MTKQWLKIKINFVIFVLLLGFFCPQAISVFAGEVNENKNPKLANYYLKWLIDDAEAEELAKWDLLILDMEVQENSRVNLKKIRQLNPNIKILAYITSQEIIGNIYQKQWHSEYGNLRKRLVDNIDDSWWLQDGAGNKISFWLDTYMLNMTNDCGSSPGGYKWNEYLPTFVKNEIYGSGLWDGVFYDNLWGNITQIENGNIDINRDGNIEPIIEINREWANGNKKMLAKSRELMGNNFIIIGNGMVYDGYQPYLNGMMFENFPSPLENGGTWSGSMDTYAKIPTVNRQPNTAVLNTYADWDNFAKVRFGLASALMQNFGYFSYDYDVADHGQLWWYDEYDVNLGGPIFPAYNILDKTNDKFKPGLWRRDFANGIAILNSTDKEQKYIFSHEEFEKINGQQDKNINNGSIINWLKISPNDGVILLKRNIEIVNKSFYNGNFIRVYNNNGVQIRNGFFSYLDNFPGNEQVISIDLDNDQNKEYITNGNGTLSFYKNGKKIRTLNPYKSKFKGEISTALVDFDNNGKYEIITGAGKGGGPQIQIMSDNGALIGTFFAYDKNFRGGVNVSGGDIGGDAKPEIVVGPGAGMEPEVRIYSSSGKLYSKFMAYDKKFKGGVNVAVGDVNGDGRNEIVTGAGSGGGPHVRIFNNCGELISQFMAYDKNVKTGVKVIVEDINNDGVDEILADNANF